MTVQGQQAKYENTRMPQMKNPNKGKQNCSMKRKSPKKTPLYLVYACAQRGDTRRTM